MRFLYRLIGGCPLDHRWQVIYNNGTTIQQECQKCGRRVNRHFDVANRKQW